MRLLVTGGQGYLGARIVARLAGMGHQVRCLDLSPPGAQPPPAATVDPVPPQAPPVEVVTGDITDPELCRSACLGVDVVVHAAAIHHASAVADNPLRSIETNVHGTYGLIRSAARAEVRRLVFLSSAKVYGEPERLPSREDDLPRPLEPYGLGKALCEYYCERARRDSALQTVVVRPFSVYGPGQDLDTGYVGMLLRALLERRALVLPGGPDLLRDFVYVDDAVEVCVRAAVQDRVPAVLNAGSGRGTRLQDLVALVAAISRSPLQPTYSAPSPGTITRTQAHLGRGIRALGLGPRRSLEDGLHATLHAFLDARPCP